MSCVSAVIRTDVTAVKLYGDKVIAGIGSYVHLFKRQNNLLIAKHKTLNAQKIYGFMPSKTNDHVIVYGGKQFAVITVNSSCIDLVCEVVVCDDWLHSAVWLSDTDVAVLTAHNVVQIWDSMKRIIKSSHASRDNSILYCGLLLPVQSDVVVFAGTVYSDVIIHCYGDDAPLHRLKGHRGVIFSIVCDARNEIIVTTSDDRSLRIWGPRNKVNHEFHTRQYWESAVFDCRREVYGHSARVMRAVVAGGVIASVGEDACVCCWDVEGNLLRRRQTHQNAGIWSVDARGNSLVTGGGDGAVILHPLATTDTPVQQLQLDVNPKKVAFTARNNLVVLDDDFQVLYYDTEVKMLRMVDQLGYKPYSQCFLGVSACKQLVAVASMLGDLTIFMENCKGEPNLKCYLETKLAIGRVLSLHWAGNRHLLLCSDKGIVTVFASKGMEIEKLYEFVLPNCKERWLTAAALDPSTQMFVLGDRCGNIHVYKPDKAEPIRTHHKVHGRYGPTFIKIRHNEVVTGGRSGSIKTFSIDGDSVRYMNTTDVNFQWVEKFLDRDEHLICGFHERDFVVYDMGSGNKVVELACGGGHRSWDAARRVAGSAAGAEELITLAYLRNTDVNIATFELSKLVSRNLVDGSHTKVINCLASFRYKERTYLFSGGEDNTLRIQLYLPDSNGVKELAVFRHLSSIRALKVLKICDDKVMLLSAGGRAQICIRLVQFSHNESIKVDTIIEHMIKGADKDRKVNKNWRMKEVDFDPETRIMDIEAVLTKEHEYTVVAACSDACLRIYRLHLSETSTFELVNEIKYHSTCILKCKHFHHQHQNYIITCTTRGDLCLWNTDEIQSSTTPTLATKTNKSGINSVAVTATDSCIRVATGGDDNDIYVTSVDRSGLVCAAERQPARHSSQVTGLHWSGILMSCSVDQRLCAAADVCTDVADVQGMEVFEDSSGTQSVCVFGKGLEIFKCRS